MDPRLRRTGGGFEPKFNLVWAHTPRVLKIHEQSQGNVAQHHNTIPSLSLSTRRNDYYYYNNCAPAADGEKACRRFLQQQTLTMSRANFTRD
jgi:hypothetical protein